MAFISILYLQKVLTSYMFILLDFRDKDAAEHLLKSCRGVRLCMVQQPSLKVQYIRWNPEVQPVTICPQHCLKLLKVFGSFPMEVGNLQISDLTRPAERF